MPLVRLILPTLPRRRSRRGSDDRIRPMRTGRGIFAGIVALLVASVSPTRAGSPLETSIRALLDARYGNLIAPRGLRVDDDGLNGVRVWMTLAPPPADLVQGRTWTRDEGERILGSVLEDIQKRFPDTQVLPSSGVEAQDHSGGVAWRHALADGNLEPLTEASHRARPRAPPEVSMDDRLAAPRPTTAPLVPGAFPLSVRESASPPASPSRSPRATRGNPDLPGAFRLAQLDPSPGMAGAAVSPTPIPLTPSGIGTSSVSAGVGTGVNATVITPNPAASVVASPAASPANSDAPTRRLLYPKDKETMQFEIEDMLEHQLASIVDSPTVRATMVRAQVVDLFVQCVFRGKRLDNAPQVLAVARDAIKLTLNDRFPGMRIHHRSRFRLREANERFVYDYELLTLDPHGVETDHDRDPFFRPLRLTRDRVIDLPNAFPMERGATGASIQYFKRFMADDNYDNLVSSRSEAVTLKLRKSFFRGFEMNVQASAYGHKVEPVQRGIFLEQEGTLSVLGLEAKYQLPYEVLGMRTAVGFTQSFQQAGERAFYLPEDFERFYSVYVAAGRRVLEHLVIHAGAIRSVATLEPLFDDETILTYGGGIEYRASPRAMLLLEVLNRTVSGDSFSRFGNEIDDRGLTVNIGGVVGTRLGDLEVLARQLTHPEIQEYQVGLSFQW